MKPNRFQIPFDILATWLSVYMNEWDLVAWFGASIIPNILFEFMYFADEILDMPDLIFT